MCKKETLPVKNCGCEPTTPSHTLKWVKWALPFVAAVDANKHLEGVKLPILLNKLASLECHSIKVLCYRLLKSPRCELEPAFKFSGFKFFVHQN